jgi:hypothetical protein
VRIEPQCGSRLAWNWQRQQPDGPDRVKAVRWFGEWTGADKPYRGGLDDGPQTPGLHSGDAGDAYERYVDFLGAVYESGRLGRAAWPAVDGMRPTTKSTRAGL